MVYPVLLTFYNSVHTIGPPAMGSNSWGSPISRRLLAHDPGVLEGGRQHRDFHRWSGRSSTSPAGCCWRFLSSGVPLARFFRVVWFTPVLMSYVVVGIIWVWIYDYDWGCVNLVLRAVGLARWSIPGSAIRRPRCGRCW